MAQYNFEWDPVKARENKRKHKVSFERAANVFLDPLIVSLEDEEHGRQEDRWVTLGKDDTGVVLVISHTFREIGIDSFAIRLISARKATRREAKQYAVR